MVRDVLERAGKVRKLGSTFAVHEDLVLHSVVARILVQFIEVSSR